MALAENKQVVDSKEISSIHKKVDRFNIIVLNLNIDRSTVRSCGKEWKDPAGFRDEMRNKRYRTGSNHRDGALSPFFIPKEKPPFIKKEFQTWRKDACTGRFSSPFSIYGSGYKDSRKSININRRKSHHAPFQFHHS